MKLLLGQLQVWEGVRALGEGVEVGQQSWKGAARSQHPSASGPRPPRGQRGKTGVGEKDNETRLCLDSCPRPGSAPIFATSWNSGTGEAILG